MQMTGELVNVLFEQSSTALVLVDSSTPLTCKRHNERFRCLVGNSDGSASLIGRSVIDFLAPQSTAALEGVAKNAAESGYALPIPEGIIVLSGNGHSHQINGTVTPLRGEDGHVSTLLLSMAAQDLQEADTGDEQRRFAEMVGQVTVSLAQPSGLTSLLQSLVGAAVQVFDAASAAVWLYNDDEKRFRMAYSHGYQPSAIEALAIIDPREPVTVVSRAVQHGRVIIVGQDDPEGPPDMATPQSRAIMRQTNTALVGAAPLVANGQMVGAISLALQRVQTSRSLIERVLTEIAPHIAGAIERERLFDQVRRQRDTARALARLAEALNVASTPTELATAVIAAIRTLLDVRTILVAETNVGGAILHTLLQYGMPPDYLKRMDRAPLSTPTVTTWVVRSGQSIEIVCDDDGQFNISDPRFELTYQMMREQHVRRFIVLPLRSSAGIFGALSTSMTSLHSLSDGDRGFLQTVADLAGETLARLRLGEEVRERAGQLEALFRHSPVGLALYDSDLCYVLINDALASLNGLPAAEHIGRSVYDVLGPDTIVGEVMRGVMESGTSYHSGTMEVSIPNRADRQPGIYNMHIAPLAAVHHGRIETKGVLAIVMDVTEEARNARLRDDFLSMASHELKTPVTSIGGFAQSLLRRAEKDHVSPSVLRAYQVIDHQCRRLATLINELLDVNRIQAGRLVIHPEYCDMARLCQLVIDQVAPTTERHHLVLCIGHSDTPAYVPAASPPIMCWCDVARIEQVLLNLLDNAIKYSPRGGTITVDVWRDDSHETVHCAVADEGIGIPGEALAHLFEPWYRAANANVSSSGGLGMGLYISDQIIQAHAGSLAVTSTTGEGTTFDMTLPAQPTRPHIPALPGGGVSVATHPA